MLKITLIICSLLISTFSFAKTCRKVDLGHEQVKICADLEFHELQTTLTNLSPAVSVERVNGFLSDGPKAAGIKICEAFDSSMLDFVATKTTKTIEGVIKILGQEASSKILKSLKPTKVLKSLDCHWAY